MTSTTTTTPTHHTMPSAELGNYVRSLVVALLADHPQGFDTAELNTLVHAADPSLPKPFVRHHVWKLDKRDPDTFKAVKGDRIALKPELQAALTTKGA